MNQAQRTGAIEAIPTEYGGVVFKSKTEAVIARAFDLVSIRTNGHAVCCWEYEPAWAKTSDGWVPDFFVMFMDRSPKREPFVIRYLAEVKPSEPTGAYMDSLIKKFLSIDCGVVDIARLCIVGSPFTNEKRYISEIIRDPLRWGKPHPWLCVGLPDELVSAARKYRFDLKGAA